MCKSENDIIANKINFTSQFKTDQILPTKRIRKKIVQFSEYCKFQNFPEEKNPSFNPCFKKLIIGYLGVPILV